MSNILEFKPGKSAEKSSTRYATGTAICLACHHEFAAIMLHGLDVFECPACNLHKAKFKFPFSLPEGTQVWTCRCKNQFFNITGDGVFCVNCGTWQTFPQAPE